MKMHKGLEFATRADFVGVKNQNTKQTVIHLSPALWEQVICETDEIGCSVAEFVRTILGAWCEGRLHVDGGAK